jgi:tetratricopeptide (TPR) repeat protein
MSRLRFSKSDRSASNRHRFSILLSLAFMCLLYFYFKAPFWVLCLFTLWIPTFYVLLPWYTKRQWTRFERTFSRKFQRQEYAELVDDYRRAWFLRRFGPRAEMLSKLAITYTAMQHFREAEHVLEQALEITPLLHRDRLYLNLANLKYELGKYGEAEAMYKALQGNSPYRHTVKTQLALIDVHRGHQVQKAKRYLEEVRERSTGSTRHRIDAVLSKASG